MGAKGWLAAGLVVAGLPAMAHDPQILAATLVEAGDAYTVSVTIAHEETGWDDYADGWRVELADGTVLGTRVLVHPHENEQPFTRTLSGVTIPEGTVRVFIRARSLKDGWAVNQFEIVVGDS